jgi:crotonobetainyl-CoA:carnitine CoA-transferase CaiB-like acyl-CoA transferase
MTDTALGDVRVLDLTSELGSYCAKLLADLGADVIKVEPPGGDPARAIGPFAGDTPGADRSLPFLNNNTNKRSVVLDLESEAGREALRKLPHAGYLAPDIVGMAMSGLMWLAGDPRDPPNLAAGQQGYICASIQAASGTMMALYHRDLTGEGQHVDVSMQEALLISQERAMQTWDMNKALLSRTGAGVALPFSVPGIGPYEASDGWIWAYLGTPGGAPWAEQLRWMDEEGLAGDLTQEPYRSVIEELDLKLLTRLALSKEEREEKGPHLTHIDEVFRAFVAAKTKWELYEQGQRRRILIGIVSTPEDLGKNPQLLAREWYQDIDQPGAGTIRFAGPPYRLSETPWRIERPAPQPGEHTAELLGT